MPRYVLPNGVVIYESYGHIVEQARETDYKYKASSANVNAGSFPSNFSIRNRLGGVLAQEGIGSCVSNAISHYIRIMSVNTNISRLFHYYVARLMQGSTVVGRTDDGLTTEHALQCVKRYGVCTESEWPYDDIMTNVNKMPPINAFRESYKNIPIHLKDFKYEYLPLSNNRETLNVVKDWLNTTNRPLLVCIKVPGSCAIHHMVNGIYLRIPYNIPTYNHMVLLVGYDDNRTITAGDTDGSGYAMLVNSWGNSFGEDGAFYISYDYLCNSSMVYCIVGLTFQW